MRMNKLINMDNTDFFEYLIKEFSVNIPVHIETIEEAEEAAKVMLICARNYQYLNTLIMFLRREVHEAARLGNKEEKTILMDKRDAVNDMISSLKLSYQAISRAITVRQGNLEELHMSDKTF